jgi:hypothetical protein
MVHRSFDVIASELSRIDSRFLAHSQKFPHYTWAEKSSSLTLATSFYDIMFLPIKVHASSGRVGGLSHELLHGGMVFSPDTAWVVFHASTGVGNSGGNCSLVSFVPLVSELS